MTNDQNISACQSIRSRELRKFNFIADKRGDGETSKARRIGGLITQYKISLLIGAKQMRHSMIDQGISITVIELR